MTKTISTGYQDFETFQKKGYFYVDKTGFIKEWWESGDYVTLITRPRRFGKTLNMSMIEQFFSVEYAGRGEMFDGLNIWKEEAYRELQGTYPVIFLSFAGIKGETYQAARGGMIQKIIDLYAKYQYLMDGDALNSQEKKYFDYIDAEMTDEVAALTLHRLSICMSRYYGKNVLILLDEYDTPLQEAYVGGYWEQLAGFIRNLFNNTFKTNPYMECGLLTGITRISKESIFSDMNNLTVITTTSRQYADCFGFTQEEVFQALDNYGLSDQRENVKDWYDGFIFGDYKDIYNPWSIISFIKDKRLKTYWANTSENSLVDKLIRQGSPQIKMTMEDLLAGKTLITEIDEEIIFHQLTRKKGAIWSLLLASGYLKVISTEFNGEKYIYHLALTNKEVRIMFQDMIKDWFAAEETPYNDFVQALLHKDLEYMNEYMNQIAETVFSSFDTGKQASGRSHPERFYHGFVLGLIVELAGEYRITSNRESGFGRYDVMLEPLKANKPAFVLEFKVRQEKEKDLSVTLKNALQQIQNLNYDLELAVRGIPREQICHYGFAFEGKRVLIGTDE